MANWFVRPNTSHHATRTGSSYEQAFGGWSEIEWTTKVTAGDTLYVCGAHQYGSIIATGAAGVIIRGDHVSGAGSLNFTGGTSFYLNVNKNNTTIQALTITSLGRCIVPSGTPLTGLTIKSCTFNGTGTVPIIEFLAIDTWAWTDTLIDGNTFNCGSGGAITGIGWWPQSPKVTYHDRIKITNNKFIGGAGSQGVIALLAHSNAMAEISPGVPSVIYINDAEVIGNTFEDCGGTGIKLYVPEYGRCKGIKIQRNTLTNMLRVGDLGGGIAVGGFIQSTTAGFGLNVIEHNTANGLQGTTGFANIMYGSYIVRYNTAKNIESVIYDGCGLLFDLGAKDCIAYSNYFENLTGPTDHTAGAGIGIIYSATNITCYGNIVKNCRMGVLYANQNSGMSSNIFNNTFLNCDLAAIVGNATTYPADSNFCRNNIFTAKNGSSAVAIKYMSGLWTKESTNVFQGFAVGTQIIHATSKTSDPLLDSSGRPKAGSPAIAAGAYIQRSAGADRKTFYNPPCIGAYEYVRSRGARL